MKIFNLLKPLIYGTWLLRNTNDKNIKYKQNYLIIDNNEVIKFKSIEYNNFIGEKISRTAKIDNLIDHNNNSYTITFKFLEKNTYTYSIIGIEIPLIRTKSEKYYKEKNITVNLYNNILIFYDNDLSNYYIFDLYLGRFKYPNTETELNTFIFTEIIGIIIGIIINNLIISNLNII